MWQSASFNWNLSRQIPWGIPIPAFQNVNNPDDWIFDDRVDEKEIILAKKEFELLYLLAQKPGKVFLRNEILNQVWGYDVIVGDRTIDVHIRKIRQKLGIDCITTVKGVGYKFEL